MKAIRWSTVAVLVFLLRPSEFIEERLLYAHLRDKVFSLLGRNSVGPGLQRAAELNRLQPQIPPEVAFPCDVSQARSPTRPQTVHELRPGDIDVVAAMGDSLTAATGAVGSRLLDIATDNRGMSWSIGGQGNWRQILTLPNILKEFNPNLVGYSLGDSFSHHRDSQFNVAVVGAMSRDLEFMVRVLVKRMKADKRVNFEKDWKLITMMIGPNDFCLDICYMSPIKFQNVAEVHRRHLTAVLDYLRDNVPRTLVNLVLVPNLSILHDLKGFPRSCDELHLFTCPCMFGRKRAAIYPAQVAKQSEWQQVEREVASDERYRRKKDFAVVLQPFTGRAVYPHLKTPKGDIADRSYLSSDCFHFSQKMHAIVANALWNNMLEPVGNKTENLPDSFTPFLCPTKERPFIFTHGNSFRRQEFAGP